MTESLEKIIERIILILVCMVGPALFFMLFKPTQKEVFAEEMTRDFLESTTSAGKISATDYMVYRDGLATIDDFETWLSYTAYHNEPVYDYYSKAEIEAFFHERNVRDAHYYKTENVAVEDADIAGLRMQQHTNATVLAKLMDEGLPLGEETVSPVYTYTTVVDTQEVYAGEYLATVLRVDTGEMVYFTEGDPIIATGSGTQTYQVYVGGVLTGATITATVWPRQVHCVSCGNDYTNTEQVLDYYKSNNVWAYCPYCRVRVRDIVADTSLLTIPAGTKEVDITGVTFTVVYLDNTSEMLTLSTLSHNYSESYSGEQDISVSYKGFHKDNVLKIVTQCGNCTVCAAQITDRNVFDCSIYPLCPTCMEAVPSFLGECAVIPETFSDDAVTERLLAEGVFPMGRNDYLMLSVNHEGARVGGKYSFLATDKDIYFRMGQRVRRTEVD